MSIRAIDLFCGAGGSSWGAHAAGAEIVAGFDRWELAGRVFQDNFPEARLYAGDLGDMDAVTVCRELGEADLILASPECTNHSLAKGAAPRCEDSRATAFQVSRFAAALGPRWIVVENVESMRKWERYGEFLEELGRLGYRCREQTLDASHFGVPQTRRRLFILCDRHAQPPEVERRLWAGRDVYSFLNLNGVYGFTPLRTDRRAIATLERADRAIAELGADEPFLIVYYGSDGAGGWQRLGRPLRTVTTLDRFAYVRPTPQGHVMRMLQPEELKLAMGWPKRFRISHGSRRDRIRMIGNAVCPKVMEAVVETLCRMGGGR